ncbi:hypothetical protein EJB00_01280 [Wolbachia endosymbiont of Drosophila mauritiana]|uniref:hypothetical protein n=2 Tax=Wolbachia TaxID=953 RepID=UPI00059F8F4E|nr:hypothetical protein [Wolbachia endosymbiont of Drosophila mauritiana]QCB63354.1 hypothetical protein EJB00_01280 [Wolbachia endosymbiont of Drosophila mauritiana]
MTITSKTSLGKSKVGEVVAVTLGGLLSMPVVNNLEHIVESMSDNSEAREKLATTADNFKKVCKSISTKNIVLSGVIAGLYTSISYIILNIHKESFKSGLITVAAAAIGGGAGAALSRTVFTKLEDVDTEQPNIPRQSI